MPLELDPSQRAAVDLVMHAPACVITGGPGCGKTTSLRVALDELDAKPAALDVLGNPIPRYLLAAPTGKAARRMQEATGRDAMTIHRLLEYGRLPEGGIGFRRCASFFIEASLVVVDEASMLDVRLARSLLDAINPRTTRLLLVGDKDQLPSVGPGRVFADVIESGKVPVARLTTLHRSARESWVCTAAREILEGRTPSLDERPDFRFVEVDSLDSARRAVVRLVSEQREGREYQVLGPQRTGGGGTVAICKAIQEAVNPAREGAKVWRRDEFEIREGDRVIQTSNNYDLGIMNGELGLVVSIEASKLVVDFDGRRVEYNALTAQGLELAYALTIHKSQGSEWPWVVVLCHSGHTFMLARQLLYTAITRAKQGVVIVGDRKGVERAIANIDPTKRNTSLVERLKKETRDAA
jgi:exodeoxyribonuclease V alpha subunit